MPGPLDDDAGRTTDECNDEDGAAIGSSTNCCPSASVCGADVGMGFALVLAQRFCPERASWGEDAEELEQGIAEDVGDS